MAQQVEDFLAALVQPGDRAGVYGRLVDWVMGLGADHVSLHLDLDGPKPSFVHTFPDWVVEFYSEKIHPLGDPRLSLCRTGSQPVLAGNDYWSAWPQQPCAIRQFDLELERISARNVAFLPMHSTTSTEWGSLAVSSRLERAEFEKLIAIIGPMLLVAGNAAFNQVQGLNPEIPEPAVPLSTREREALLWLGRGYRNNRIAERMGVRPVTVEFYLAAARRKLGAKTREQALVRAVQQRLINP